MENGTDVPLDFDAIRRRKYYIIVPTLIIFAIAATVVYRLPPIFRSSGTILIEPQGATRDLIQDTQSNHVEERLQKISQFVLSRKNLIHIVNSLNLYADLRDKHDLNTIVMRMKKAIVMEPLKAKRGHNTVVTGFTISYEGKNPDKVTQVADILLSSYQEENKRNQERQTQGTFDFLEKQLVEIRNDIQTKEKQLAEFKVKHINALPDLMQLNLQTLEKIDREVEGEKEKIKSLNNQKIYLEGQLASVSSKMAEDLQGVNQGTLLKDDRDALRSLYLSKSATLAAEHPDVIALKKKLDAMETEMLSRDRLEEHKRQLELKEKQLSDILMKFTSKHPNVIKLKKEIAKLETEINNLSVIEPTTNDNIEISNDPLYITLQTHIATISMEISVTEKQIKRLEDKYNDYKGRVEKTPVVEQQYQVLMRDLKNARDKYQEIQRRLMTAREDLTFLESQMAEKFNLVDPPSKPVSPYKPNRNLLLLMGFVIALGVGIGTAILVEYRDQSVYQATELANLSGKTVLAVIPNLKPYRRKTQRIHIVWKIMLIIALSIAMIITYLWAGGTSIREVLNFLPRIF